MSQTSARLLLVGLCAGAALVALAAAEAVDVLLREASGASDA